MSIGIILKGWVDMRHDTRDITLCNLQPSLFGSISFLEIICSWGSGEVLLYNGYLSTLAPLPVSWKKKNIGIIMMFKKKIRVWSTQY